MRPAIDSYVHEVLASLDTPLDLILDAGVLVGVALSPPALPPMILVTLRAQSQELGIESFAVNALPMDEADPEAIFHLTLDLWWRVRADLLLQDSGFYAVAADILDLGSS